MQSFDLFGKKSITIEDFHASCAPNVAKYKLKIDKLQVLKFLAGFNPEFDQARADILGREPFPT